MGTYNKTSNAQIAKNSFLLYIRTFITIFISIYTSRMVLLKLGETDFGIFSVVGGVAILFSFLGSTFFIATQRFLTIAIVKTDVDGFKRVFSTSIQCYILLSLVIFVLGECIGLYIVNHILNIDQTRMIAANYSYQFALVSLILGLTNAPYKASIIAFEKYSYYAYTDVLFKCLRLAIVFILAFSPIDKLIMYSALYMTVNLLSFIIDKIYCHIQFEGCRFIKCWDKQLFLEITKFSTISLFKKTAESCNNQGNNILINIYGGVVANASYGLSNQVWGTLTGFFLNLQTGFSPQITKSFGALDLKRFNRLIVDSCRFSGYMVILLSIPLVLNMPFFLKIWLADVPRYASSFCTIVIFSCFVSALINPLNTAITATGEIKRYQYVTSLIYVVSIPVSLFSLQIGLALSSVFIVKIICQIAEGLYGVQYLSKIADFEVIKYLKECAKSCVILLFCLSVPYIITLFADINELISVLLSTIIGETLFILIVWKWGLSFSEKNKIRSYFTKICHSNN